MTTEKDRVSKVAKKWWSTPIEPFTDDTMIRSLTTLLLKEIKRAERRGREAGYKKATEDQLDIRIRERRKV